VCWSNNAQFGKSVEYPAEQSSINQHEFQVDPDLFMLVRAGIGLAMAFSSKTEGKTQQGIQCNWKNM